MNRITKSLSTLTFALFAVAVLDGSITFADEAKSKFSDEAFRKHIKKLKSEMPDGEFHVVIEKPFVVIGDDTLKEVKRWASGTVRWTVDRVKKQYFPENPSEIIDIWLFKDKDSYERNCEKIVGYKPHTPYGFYSGTHRAIIMNISTGGGTLVHEIVHPFIESNFPECPSWFNEGLASLYEQCKDNDGKIWGLTNWRLRGLQFNIESRTLPSTKELCSTTTKEFYDSDKGDNYAQARYLCYYLQQNDLLKSYYDSFRANVKKDPTGYNTLQKSLEESNMAEFDSRWKKFCLGLKY